MGDKLTEAQMMPKEPTPEMMDVMLASGAKTNKRYPKPGAWDALVTYRDLYECIAALARHEEKRK